MAANASLNIYTKHADSTTCTATSTSRRHGRLLWGAVQQVAHQHEQHRSRGLKSTSTLHQSNYADKEQQKVGASCQGSPRRADG